MMLRENDFAQMILPKAKVRKQPSTNSAELAGFQAFKYDTSSPTGSRPPTPPPRNPHVLITAAFLCPTLKVLLDTTRPHGLFTQGEADLLEMEIG